MNAAIITRFVRGDQHRIVCRMGSDLSGVYKYPEGLDRKNRHCFAAANFALANYCFGLYIGAQEKGQGVVWVPLPEIVTWRVLSGLRDARKPEAMECRHWFFNPSPDFVGFKGSFPHAISQP